MDGNTHAKTKYRIREIARNRLSHARNLKTLRRRQSNTGRHDRTTGLSLQHADRICPRTDTVLGKNEERLRLATGAARLAVRDWDIASDTVQWTDTGMSLFGRTRGTASLSRTWAERIHPDDRGRVLAAVRAALQTGAESFSAEYRFLTGNGRWAHIEDRALIARDDRGNAVRMVGAMQDVTEQRRNQDELRQSHEDLERKVQERTDELTRAYELLRRIFASITVHIAYLDRDYNFISVNRAYAETDGREPAFFEGKNYFTLYPDEDDRRIFRRVVETGESYSMYEKPFIPPHRPDSDITYWDLNVQPVKDPDGTVSGILLSSVNVTDRKRAEENNIRLAAAIESAADAVVISDVRGIIKYVNPAFEKITGFSKKEAVGADLHILDGGKHDEAFFRDLRETIRRAGFWKGRLLNRKKDGTIYHEECTYSPIKNNRGQIISYVAIKRDVTEKLWLESIAQSVETMNNIGYIFAGVRHEIGNPVNAVNMILEVLRSKLSHLEKPAIDGYLERALHELSRVGYILRTLKTYNMYERPQLQDIALREFMEKFVSVVHEDFRSRGITITLSIAPDTGFCQADPRALQQILLNFLANASDALEGNTNGLIELGVFRAGGMVRIRVRDNGCGMTEEEQKALFKPFYTTKAKGTGLGLVIVKKMLTLMKGTIEIFSSKNSGTVVEIGLRDGSRSEVPEKHFDTEVTVHEKER